MDCGGITDIVFARGVGGCEVVGCWRVVGIFFKVEKD